MKFKIPRPNNPQGFKKGDPRIKRAPGGLRNPPGGRPLNMFRNMTRKELFKNNGEMLKKLGAIARGRHKFIKVIANKEGVHQVPVDPSGSDMISAAIFLRDSTFGRPHQAMSFEDADGNPTPAIVMLPAQDRGVQGSVTKGGKK